MQYVAFALFLYLALVFAASGLSKLIAVPHFRGALARQAILPKPFIPFVAWALPVLEVALAILLFVPGVMVWAAASIALLTGVFATVTLVLMAQGRATECGCFGLLYREQLGWTTVLRDTTLITMAAVAAGFARFSAPPDQLLLIGAVAIASLTAWSLAAPPIVGLIRNRTPHEVTDAELVEWPSSTYSMERGE